MKRISLFLAVALLGAPVILRAQDAATEERLNKLNAQIEVLTEMKDQQNKRIEELTKAVEALQRKMDQPKGDYASADDMKRLAESLKEVDRKRQEDNDRILEGIKKELKSFAVAPAKSTPAVKPTSSSPDTTNLPTDGFEYIVKQGDTLAVIVKAYRDQNVKVTTDQVLKANPGLKPEKLRVGQKIFIPKPQ